MSHTRARLTLLAAFLACAACGERSGSSPRVEARAAPAPIAPAPPAATAVAGAFPTTTSRTHLTLGIVSGAVDVSGRPARIPCMTCHRLLTPSDASARASRLERFHTGVVLRHGSLVCLTCHRAEGRDRLGLADGSPLDYANVKALCGQCHARRLEEYERGAHGGMTGYWDTTRGPRTRNLCTDCHDPHAPRPAQVVPVPQARVTH